jgi:hypothetical protein
MRYELIKGNGQANRWYTIDIMPINNDEFAVVITYGMKDPQGDDAVVQPLKSIFNGSYHEALQVLFAKTQIREKIGYVKIKPKSDE